MELKSLAIFKGLPRPVDQVLEFDDFYVVRLDYYLSTKDKIFNENVFGISKDGKVLWQVDQAIQGVQWADEHCPYTNIAKEGEDAVYLCPWRGVEAFIVEARSGKLIKRMWEK